jgi:nitroreductase
MPRKFFPYYNETSTAESSLDTLDTIRTVCIVRKFSDEPVQEDVVRDIVEEAHLTASSRNRQVWQVVVVRQPELLRQPGSLARTGPYVAHAQLTTVVALSESKFAVSDAIRAIQSTILPGWSKARGV